ncbi:SPOR domain-containing protein [Maribellus sp. YY47]|uniref:SPOR domain-containing protein n=1 Tax=Maribellus sp. YY47 TaxID=2929486 RepID=UPI002000D7E4|nr:SPOR domain-containing protein [Maribellus sp. YY47]MCK3685895.1 SPOR domain-containing protein [Maribellus sp. YY47]
MMRILILFLAVFFVAQFACAQEVVGLDAAHDSVRVAILDQLQVERDPVLDKMLGWHIEKNHEKEGMDGFRVEIFFSSKMDAKEQALKTKVDFLSEYPDYPVHIKFVAPNFRVRVGDFRTKNEAWKLYRKIQKEYPTAFVVPDVINFPLLKQNL